MMLLTRDELTWLTGSSASSRQKVETQSPQLRIVVQIEIEEMVKLFRSV